MADMNLHQQMALGQALSVQMQQSLHLLQAPALELQSLVQQEISANPVLEEISEQPSSSDEMDEPPATASETQRDEDWKEYFSQSNGHIRVAGKIKI
ncbi:MAG: RNA polymerase sigma-54 factor, partial [Verrucomicrobiota bacterium]